MFDRNEYARQCQIVRNTPLHRASCPPADELASLRDSAIEHLADDVLQNAISDPDFMMELVLENDYNYQPLQDMCKALCSMMDTSKTPTSDSFIINAEESLESKIRFANAMQEFIEMKAASLAEQEIGE